MYQVKWYVYYKENLETVCVSLGSQRPFQGKQETWRKRLTDFIHEKQKIHYFTPIRMATMKNNNNRKQALAWGRDVDKLEPLYIADGNVKWHSCHRKWYGNSLKKLNTELSFDPAVPLLGVYPKATEAGTWINTYTPKFIAALFNNSQKSGSNPKGHQQMNE